MALSIKFTPGYTFTENEVVTTDKLNALANPTVELEGGIGTQAVADNSVTTPKLVDGALSADWMGRAKMAEGYLTLGKIASGAFTADATGRAKFANGFVTAALLASDAKMPPVNGLARNLVLQPNPSTPLSWVDVTADEIILKDALGAAVCVSGINVTASIVAPGAGGLDVGAEANSTWYYVWVIWNGTMAHGLLSLSATAPTLPAGYTFSARVGVVYNGDTGDFRTFYQAGNQVWMEELEVFNEQDGVATYTPATLATFVPTIARTVTGNMGSSSTTRGMAVAGSATGLGAQVVHAASGSDTLAGFKVAAPFVQVPLPTPQTIFWKTANAGSPQYRITVTGFTI